MIEAREGLQAHHLAELLVRGSTEWECRTQMPRVGEISAGHLHDIKKKKTKKKGGFRHRPSDLTSRVQTNTISETYVQHFRSKLCTKITSIIVKEPVNFNLHQMNSTEIWSKRKIPHQTEKRLKLMLLVSGCKGVNSYELTVNSDGLSPGILES